MKCVSLDSNVMLMAALLQVKIELLISIELLLYLLINFDLILQGGKGECGIEPMRPNQQDHYSHELKYVIGNPTQAINTSLVGPFKSETSWPNSIVIVRIRKSIDHVIVTCSSSFISPAKSVRFFEKVFPLAGN